MFICYHFSHNKSRHIQESCLIYTSSNLQVLKGGLAFKVLFMNRLLELIMVRGGRE